MAVFAFLFAGIAAATVPIPLSAEGPVWDAPLLFEDLGPYAPFRADAWPGPAERLVEVNASVLHGPFAFAINGRRIWKIGEFLDTEAGEVAAARLPGTAVIRVKTTDSDALSTLTTDGQRVAGVFSLSGERWELYPVEGTTHRLVRDDEAPFVCATDSRVPSQPRRRAVRFGTALGNWDVTEWNLGLYYNQRWAATLGGEANAQLRTQLFADAENTALIETGHTYARVSLVVSRLVSGENGSTDATDYASIRNIDEGLTRFRKDPVIRRERYDRKISVAGYLDATSDIGSGLAYIFRGGLSSASGVFAVFEGKIRSVHTVIHEIGHTVGLDHDRSTAASDARKGTLGFINCDREVQCAMSGASCFAHKQLFYSNPAHAVRGQPFGSEESNAAAVIRENRFIVRDKFWEYAI